MIIGDHEFFDPRVPEERDMLEAVIKMGAPVRCLERRYFDEWVRRGGPCDYRWYSLAWGIQYPSEQFIYTILESRYIDE